MVLVLAGVRCVFGARESAVGSLRLYVGCSLVSIFFPQTTSLLQQLLPCLPSNGQLSNPRLHSEYCNEHSSALRYWQVFSNQLFRGHRAFMDYPEMVLVDFGHATGIDDVTPLKSRKKQANDVARTGNILNEVLGGVVRSHARLSDELFRMMRFSVHHGSVEQADRHLLQFLIQLRDRSLIYRWEHDHELSARVLGHLEKQLVELAVVFPELA